WSNENRFRSPRMQGEIINRHLDRLARTQSFDMINEQVIIERVRVIEINLMPQFDRHITQIAIIAVLLKVGYVLIADIFNNASRSLFFPQSSSATDPDDHVFTNSKALKQKFFGLFMYL